MGADTTIYAALAWLVVFLVVLVPGYVGYMRERRQRKRLERQVIEIAESLPGAVFQWRNPTPTRRASYEFLSRNTDELRGVDRVAALGNPDVILDTVMEGDRERLLAAAAEGERLMQPIRVDYRVIDPRGGLRWMRTSAAPRRQWDGTVLWSGHWADITEEKRLEGDLRAAKEAADAANRAKSTFLATVSHEIRTPMNGVLGMLELLAMTPLESDQRASLAVVRESSKSLLRIIDDILDFSKVEAGRLELRPEPVSLARVLERVHGLYSGTASSKGLLLTMAVDERLSPWVLADALRVQQILGNLVSNAIKFTGKGEVSMRADLVERLDGEDYVRLTVADTGIGITAEDQLRLFQPFVQASGIAASRYGGTGLGLSISKRLAELMGGSVEMRSRTGAGTEVEVMLRFPIARQPAGTGEGAAFDGTIGVVAARPAPTIEQAERERTLVLIVDDHPINRMVLARQVRALGYACEVAQDGLVALDLWSGDRFGLVVTDCNMPELSGYQLTRHIRAAEERHGHARTPIIACTANALGGEAERCLAEGMDDYLSKPVELARLAEKLNRWLPLPEAPLTHAPAVMRAALSRFEPLDRAVVEEISAGNPVVAREVLVRFHRYNSEDAQRLRGAVSSGDFDRVCEAAHRIRGSSRTVGASDLAIACERMEAAAGKGDWDAVAQAMEDFDREVGRMDRHISGLAAA